MTVQHFVHEPHDFPDTMGGCEVSWSDDCGAAWAGVSASFAAGRSPIRKIPVY
jgi:hypothetical protein